MPDLFDSLPLGARVVVRYRLRPADPRDGGDLRRPTSAGRLPPTPSLSDALGALINVEYVGGQRSVRILTRTGEVVIPTRDITHAKPVPPPPPRK